MTELRGDLAAIIAVYADGDRDFDKIVKPQHRDMKEALVETLPSSGSAPGQKSRSPSHYL